MWLMRLSSRASVPALERVLLGPLGLLGRAGAIRAQVGVALPARPDGLHADAEDALRQPLEVHGRGQLLALERELALARDVDDDRAQLVALGRPQADAEAARAHARRARALAGGARGARCAAR